MTQCSGYITKTQFANLSYSFNWATEYSYLNDGSDSDKGWLQGDVIATSEWEVVDGPDGLLVIDDDNNTSVITTVKLSGGTLGTDEAPNEYLVMNRITTGNGDSESQILKVRMIR